MNVVQQFYQLLQSELQTLRAPQRTGRPASSSTASAPTAPASDFLCGKCGLPLVHRKKAGKGAASTSGAAAATAPPAARSTIPPRTADLTSTTRVGYR